MRSLFFLSDRSKLDRSAKRATPSKGKTAVVKNTTSKT